MDNLRFFTRQSMAKQHGVLTLAVSMTILMLSTLVTFNVSRAILMEQKITNNDTRSKYAFEAAEAGMISAVDYITTDPDRDGDGVLDPLVFNLVSDADNLGDSNTNNVGSSTVTVTLTDIAGDMSQVRIVSIGLSDDRSASRTITQILVTINPLPNAPDNPVITRGSMIIGGSATVHNPEGHSTIWTGSEIDMGSNASTSTEVPDVGGAGYPTCMDIPGTCSLVAASDNTIKGLDVIENDSSLSALSGDDFFENFFGASPTSYRASMVTLDTIAATANADIDLASHEVIWIDGDTNFTGVTVGCESAVTGSNVCPAGDTKPSIIIVDGDVSFSGGNQFYGIVFVRGAVNISGNTTIRGAVVTAGDAVSSTGGSLDVWYNSSILAGTSLAGASTGSAGTWKDF
jgi:hypothetical protein